MRKRKLKKGDKKREEEVLNERFESD